MYFAVSPCSGLYVALNARDAAIFTGATTGSGHALVIGHKLLSRCYVDSIIVVSSTPLIRPPAQIPMSVPVDHMRRNAMSNSDQSGHEPKEFY